jgi:hypothetical protein
MHKPKYLLALAWFLAIPAVLLAEGIVFRLLDPELARGLSDYTRYYRLIDLARRGAMVAAGGVVLVLWVATSYVVLKAKQRSLGWLVLTAGGPVGFAGIAMLRDLAPGRGDLYQQFVWKLRTGWRAAFEIAVFVLIWILAFQSMVLKHDLMVYYESFTTGTPIAIIIEQQNAESGMRAFGEGMEVMYLVVLLYLLWPIAFNLAGKVLNRQTAPAPGDAR